MVYVIMEIEVQGEYDYEVRTEKPVAVAREHSVALHKIVKLSAKVAEDGTISFSRNSYKIVSCPFDESDALLLPVF